jgi:hypothetical protein
LSVIQRRTFENKPLKENPVGYCMFEGHSGFVTLDLMRIHKCELRKCRKFIKLNHEYWDIKEPITTVSSNKGSGD